MCVTVRPHDHLGICGVSRVIRESVQCSGAAESNQLMLPLSARMKEAFQWKIGIVCKWGRWQVPSQLKIQRLAFLVFLRGVFLFWSQIMYSLRPSSLWRHRTRCQKASSPQMRNLTLANTEDTGLWSARADTRTRAKSVRSRSAESWLITLRHDWT